MASGYGENSKPKATSDEYRNSPYWASLEAEKKRKAEESKTKTS